MQTFMLDTNVFNRKISPSQFVGQRLIVTHIQEDELRATPDDQRREQLLCVFKEIETERVPTSSAAWGGISEWDECGWGAEDGVFEKMLARLQELDKDKRKPLANQKRDILIAETAIKLGAILVSRDANLRQVVTEFGGQAIDSAAARAGNAECAHYAEDCSHRPRTGRAG